MAGFLDNITSGIVKPISDAFKRLSSAGLQYKDQVIQNSITLEQEPGSAGNRTNRFNFGDNQNDIDPSYAEFLNNAALADYNFKKYVPFFDNDYASKRSELQRFSMNGEIDFILSTLSNDSIVFDTENKFCYVDTSKLEDYSEEVRESARNRFEEIYTLFFGYSDMPYRYYRQWLIEGVIAFEIVYDDIATPSQIIGFHEVDPVTLKPEIRQENDGSFYKVWVHDQNSSNYGNARSTANQKELYDSQIIFISFGTPNQTTRVSYAETLVRSYNLLRIMEHSRVIWNLMNSSFRLKAVVPTGSVSGHKMRQKVSEFKNEWKEDIHIDDDSGEISVNGQPNFPFHKTFVIPSAGGEQVEIDSMNFEGPDLSNMEAVKWFRDNLRRDSKIPFERFEREQGGGEYTMNVEGIAREEMRYNRFINQLRSTFEEIIRKPLYHQMLLDYPQLQDDMTFQSKLGIKYNRNNLFEEMKKAELVKREVETISTVQNNLMEEGGEQPYIPTEWAINKFLNQFTEEEMEDLKEARKNREIRKKKEEQGEGEGEAGAGAEDMGGDEGGLDIGL